MPTSGPNYFSTVSAINSNWISPQHAEGAPDGQVTKWSPGTSSDWLFCFDWQGTFPTNYFYDFPNFVIEIYASSLTITAILFKTQIISRADGLVFSGVSSDKSVIPSLTKTWLNIANTDWSIPYNLPTNKAIGVALAIDQTSASQVEIDSVRLTISYNNNDGFYFPGYGPSKKKRRFINKKGKVIGQTRTR